MKTEEIEHLPYSKKPVTRYIFKFKKDTNKNVLIPFTIKKEHSSSRTVSQINLISFYSKTLRPI